MASLKYTIGKNVAWITFSTLVAQFINFFIVVAISRNLFEEGLGQYSFVFAFVQMIFLFSDIGLNQYFFRNASRESDDIQPYFEKVFTMKLVLGFLCSLVSVGSAFLTGKGTEIALLIIIASFVQYTQSLCLFFGYLLRTQNKHEWEAISSVFERIICLAVGVYLLYTQKSLFLFIGVMLFSNTLRLLYMLFHARKYIKFKLKIDLKLWRNVMIQALPFFVISMTASIVRRFDILMISFMKGDIATGLYSSAYKLIDVIQFLPSILAVSAFPSLSRLYKFDKAKLVSVSKQLMRYLFMLIVPIIVGTMVIADRIISFVYGETFLQGGTISLQILIWVEYFSYVIRIPSSLLIISGKKRTIMFMGIAAAVFNIILNFVLIPKYSFIGAGIATILSMVLIYLIYKMVIRKTLLENIFSFDSYYIKIILAAIGMGIFVYFVKNSLNLFFLISSSAIIYCVILLILKLKDQDRRLLKETLKDFRHKLKNPKKDL